MTLRDIAYKNIRGNFSKYIMYYLSNTLVVFIFFIFANFILNPTVRNLETMGQKGQIAANTMVLCEVVIIVFTLFFTAYSISSFLKSREKEFGLLAMFGLTKSQVRRYVIYENLIVSTISIVTGIVIGIIFTKLFLMAVSVMLAMDSEIPFNISLKAVSITVVCFMLVFQTVNIFASFKIKNNNIIELIKGARIPKPVPEFSRVKTVAAVLLICLGYGLAAFSGQYIILTMFPVLILTVTGTYFLFSQFSIYLTRRLKENTKLFYKGTNMITLSQIIYKLSDNARVLFMVAILGAVALTASASVYSAQKSITGGIFLTTPQDISYYEIGVGKHDVLPEGKVEEVLSEHGFELDSKVSLTMLEAKSTDDIKFKSKHGDMMVILANTKDFNIMSNSDYNRLAKIYSKEAVKLQKDEVLIHSYNSFGAKHEKVFKDIENLNLDINGSQISLKLKNEICGGIINGDYARASTAVVNDETYEALSKLVPDEQKKVHYGYNIRNWYRSGEAVKKVAGLVPEARKTQLLQRVTDLGNFVQTLNLFLFIGTFIAVLFCLATGSIIYFKMFNELQKDRQEYLALRKIGMADKEMRKVVSTQTFIVFMAPFLVAFTHSAFAIKALSNLLLDNLGIYFITVALFYMLFQLSYYLFAKGMYFRQIKNMGI